MTSLFSPLSYLLCALLVPLVYAREPRIAVIGAGPSGITAASTLKRLGYTNVTVFESRNRIGGKVNSLASGAVSGELGATYATPDYHVTLAFASEYSIPYTEFGLPKYVLTPNGAKVPFANYAIAKYGLTAFCQSVENYKSVLIRFGNISRDGFAGLDNSQLGQPFSSFAQQYGIVELADMMKPIITGFGYAYYETVSAAYILKVLTQAVKVGTAPCRTIQDLQQVLIPVPFYVFPTGFQSLWEAVARDLQIRLGTRVTKITRTHRGNNGHGQGQGAPLFELTLADGTVETYDRVISSIPIEILPTVLDATPEEASLFSLMNPYRFRVSLFIGSGIPGQESVFPYESTTHDRLNHVVVWANRNYSSGLYLAYQLANQTGTTDAELQTILESDLARLVNGSVVSTVITRNWSYFPHIQPVDFQAGFFDQIEAMQGERGLYLVGGGISFESVEYAASYAKTLIEKHFSGPN